MNVVFHKIRRILERLPFPTVTCMKVVSPGIFHRVSGRNWLTFQSVLTDYTAQHHRRQLSSFSSTRKPEISQMSTTGFELSTALRWEPG
jgi:hypothetical protein